MLGRSVAVACLLALAIAPCRADDEFDTAREVAKRVAELVRAKGDTDLRALLEDPEADPWLVVDALLEAKLGDAAKAFAAAYQGKDAPALRAVAARGLREPSDARKRLAEAEERLKAEPAEEEEPEAAGEAALKMLTGGESIPDGVLLVRWLTTRAAAMQRAERLRDSAAELERAADIAQRAGWKSRAVDLMVRAATAAHDDHDERKALDLLWRTAELFHAMGNWTAEAGVLLNVAELYQRFGEVREALLRIQQALDVLPADASPIFRATLQARRGALLADAGDARQGLAELIAATNALRSPTHGDALALADACVDLAHLQRKLGDLVGARRSYQDALASYQRIDASESPEAASSRSAGVAAVRANLAALLVDEGKFLEAYQEFKDRRAAFQAIRDRGLAARALQAMAEVRLRQVAHTADRDQRRIWLEEARSTAMAAILESRDAHDPESALRASGNLGEAEEGLKRTDEAIRIYEDVIKQAQERGLSDIVLEYSAPLARTRLQRGNSNGAIEAVERAFHCLSVAFGDLGDQTRIQARARSAELYELGMRAALEKDPKDGRALFFRFLEKGRAAALLEALENREVLRARGVPHELEQARVQAARTLTDRKAALGRTGDDLQRIRSAKVNIDEAQAEYDRAVDSIQADARVGAHPLYPQPISLADAQKGLTANEALVLYANTGANAHAMLVTQDSASITPLGSAGSVSALCRKTLVRNDDPEAIELWREAEAAIWAPIERQLPAAVTTVYVSPDGDLGLLPFPALPTAGKNRGFFFVPSASVLLVLKASAMPRGRGTLAVGISNYDALAERSGGAFSGSRALGNLKAAEAEAAAVAADPTVDVVLPGPKATEEAVLTAISKRPIWSALHFAVHGQTGAKNPTLASLALAPSGNDDGDLTAFEIMQHSIPANIAVLAACDSGGGGLVRGEGLVGLVRAFLFAGCPRVVANLWNARDEAAKTFSIAFHKEWRKGAPLANALESARAEVRKNPKWQHPFYWAGWCAWGGGK